VARPQVLSAGAGHRIAAHPATPPAQGEAIVAQIPGAKIASLDAAHISNVEQPQAFTDTVLAFLKG
jgi:pimeloyl-ACP methyl ester carboxylesterase